MSLWLQSLDLCLYDSGEDSEERAKCILAHLSMKVPRSWWEHALQTGSIPDSYIHILYDLQKELMKITALPELPEFGLLVALGFIDEHIEDQELLFGTVYSQYSIEEYLSKAKGILNKRNDLCILGKMIDKNLKFLP